MRAVTAVAPFFGGTGGKACGGMNACAPADCAMALDGRAAKNVIAAEATTSAPAMAMRSCDRRGFERVNQRLVFIDFLSQRITV